MDEAELHPWSVLRREVEAKMQNPVAEVVPRVVRHGRQDIVLVQLGDEGLRFWASIDPDRTTGCHEVTAREARMKHLDSCRLRIRLL